MGIDFDRGDSETIFGLTLGLDLKGGTHLVYEAIPNKGRDISNEDMEGARKILERRVNSFGISESSVQIVGSGSGVNNKLLVQLPGLSDLNINEYLLSFQLVHLVLNWFPHIIVVITFHKMQC